MAQTPPPHVTISRLAHSYGDVPAIRGMDLGIHKGELMAVVGPSGSGKTTLLNIMAGHILPDAGEVDVDGECITCEECSTPPEKRGVGIVFQDHALFPHMTVEDNVRYGLRHLPIATQRHQVADWLTRVGLDGLAGRYPHELSGGQQQRVAIVRALATKPRVLLLDEPFANLDPEVRLSVRAELVRLIREEDTTCLLITHDQSEALAVADRIAVMHDGRILQVDTPENVYAKPASRDVACFIGRVNVIAGTFTGGSVETVLGVFPVRDFMQHLNGRPAEILIRPEALTVDPEAGGSRVVSREFHGHDVVYGVVIKGHDGIVYVRRDASAPLRVGDEVGIHARFGSVESSPCGVTLPSRMEVGVDVPEADESTPQVLTPLLS